MSEKIGLFCAHLVFAQTKCVKKKLGAKIREIRVYQTILTAGFFLKKKPFYKKSEAGLCSKSFKLFSLLEKTV